jgi:hypothetical protein
LGKKSGSGSGMNIPDYISEILEKNFWVKILKFIDAYPGFGMEKIRIRYGKNRIRDKKSLTPQRCNMSLKNISSMDPPF